MNIQKPKHWLLPALCYAAALLLWLGLCVFFLARDTINMNNGSLKSSILWLNDFTLEGVKKLEGEDGTQMFVSTDPDPRLLYAPAEPFPATRFVFAATPHKPSGGMALYYTTQMDEEFQDRNIIWAKQDAQGRWYFDLQGRQVARLRLDPDTTGGVIWTVDTILLNEPKPIWQYFVPGTRAVFFLLFAPGFLAVLLREGATTLRMAHLRRRAKK